MTRSKHVWTDAQMEILSLVYPHIPTEWIAAALGTNDRAIYAKARSMGLSKSAAYLASPFACRLRRGEHVGKESQFKPGHTTWNKGMKGLDIGGKETRFKPGHRGGKAAKLYQPIGTERISKDGYRQRKINDDMPLQKRWRGVHIIAWEEANGPLPNGHAIVFKDGNKQNCDLENLELVTRADLMRRNSYHTNYPKEIAQLIQLRGAVTRQINKREGKSHGK